MFIDNPLSLYLHIPFCSVRCTYCAFNTYTDLDALIPDYVNALCHELTYLAEHNPHPFVKTIFLGGGTPSLLSPEQYAVIFETIHRKFELADTIEISLESNPNDLNTDYLKALYDIGFNRLSIGMQSATAHVLDLFKREHDVDMVETGFYAARQAGFNNINLDVIFASPLETFDDWQKTVDMLMHLKPEHISMYGLELKGGTVLREQVDNGELPTPDDDLFADMYEYASDMFITNHYEQYEISNWCQPDYQCQHNLQYWRNLPYAGLGAGAHGFAGGYRYSTITAPQRYVQVLLDPTSEKLNKIFPLTPAVGKTTLVEHEEDLNETVMMGLRLTHEGLNREAFNKRFGMDFVDMFPEQVDRFSSLGLLQVEPDRVHLTVAGRLLSNAVIREFI